GGIAQWGAIQAVAPLLGVEVSPIELREPSEIEHAVTDFARAPNGGLILTGAGGGTRRELIITLAARHTDCPLSIPTLITLPPGVWPPMALMLSTCTGARRDTWIAFSKARSRPSFRYRRRPSTGWPSTSRRPRHSGSRSRQPYSPAPTRGSNDEASQVHHAYPRRGRSVASCGRCGGGGGDGAHRGAGRVLANGPGSAGTHDRTAIGASGIGLDRGPQPAHRRTLGRRRHRPA